MTRSIATSADAAYFPALMALLRSLRRTNPHLPVTVFDGGLTRPQAAKASRYAEVVPRTPFSQIENRGKFSYIGNVTLLKFEVADLDSEKVLYLDEPTLGLDLSMQGRLRRFLAEYNERSGVTMMLTSHYMADVTALCPRVILIHQGELLYDGELAGLAARLAPFKLVNLTLRNGSMNSPSELNLSSETEIITRENGRLTLRVPRDETPALTAHLLNTLSVADLSVEDPPIEAVIDQIYHGAKISA